LLTTISVFVLFEVKVVVKVVVLEPVVFPK